MKSKVNKIQFRIEGMDCPSCALSLERSLNAKSGGTKVDYLSGILTSENESLTHNEIKQVVESHGFKLFLVDKIVVNSQRKATRPSSKTVPRWKIWSLALSAIIIGLGFLAEFWQTSPLLHDLIFLTGIIVGGWQIGSKGLLAARSLRLDMNFLMSAAVIGAALIGQWSEAAAVVVLFSLAQLLEAYTLEKSRKAITGLMDLSPRMARVISDGREIQVPIDEVIVGSAVLVKPGERIPVDGVVKSGLSNINQSSITGESRPVAKGPGDIVYAGTFNQDGALSIMTSHAPGDTTLDHIIHLVEEAQAQKAPSQSFVDKFSVIYTPVVVGLAVVLALAPPLLFGGAWHDWIYRALALLVISCPCALVISTPVTVVSALANAARNGVLIKGGIHLENLARIKAMAFDKTGTITSGKPVVSEIISLNGASKDEIIWLAASVESHSEHQIGRAITDYVRQLGIRIDEPVEFKAIPGRGASAIVRGRKVYAGNKALFEESGIDLVGIETRLAEVEKSGSAILVGTEIEVLGIIGIADSVKDNTRAVIAEIRDAGIERTILLTGDNEQIGQAVSGASGLDKAFTGLLPEQKVVEVRRLREEYGEVAMVGDGINDAPALAAASIGIAMGQMGSDTALETADITLMSDDLTRIPWVLRLSRKARAIIFQNIAFSIVIKLLFLILASAGLATLWMAVFADMGVSLIVIFNGMRALRSG
jgi:Zn2+/Cd2+-exporting ATPase